MRTRWIVLGSGALVILILFAFPQWWPLVNRSPVSDALPGLADLPLEEQVVLEQIARNNLRFAEALIQAGLAGASAVPLEDQAMPVMLGATVYKKGDFTGVDAVRRAGGEAVVYEVVGDASLGSAWVIRLENFEVRNGPELHVFLSANPAPRTPEEVREGGLGIDLGPLKGTMGSQNFSLPAGFDMSPAQSVVIFSIPFQEVFATAQLF